MFRQSTNQNHYPVLGYWSHWTALTASQFRRCWEEKTTRSNRMKFRLQKTCDYLEFNVLPSCKVWAQTDKNCKSYWPRLQFQVLCWPGVFNAIQDDEIHFLCYCPKYLKLRKEFFVQIKSHLHNFQQLSYWDLVIKMINSMICILIYDWRLTSHYWIICVTVYKCHLTICY